MGLEPVVIDGRAIDPLAIIFKGPIYYKIIEKKFPRSPNVKQMATALAPLSPAEKKTVSSQVKTYLNYLKAVDEAISG